MLLACRALLEDGALELQGSLSVKVRRLHVSDRLFMARRQNGEVGGGLLRVMNADDISHLQLLPEHLHKGGASQDIDLPVVDLLVRLVPEIVIVALFHRVHGKHADKGRDRGTPVSWGQSWDELQDRNEQEIDVRNSLELVEQVHRNERDDGVLGRPHEVCAILGGVLLRLDGDAAATGRVCVRDLHTKFLSNVERDPSLQRGAWYLHCSHAFIPGSTGAQPTCSRRV